MQNYKIFSVSWNSKYETTLNIYIKKLNPFTFRRKLMQKIREFAFFTLPCLLPVERLLGY